MTAIYITEPITLYRLNDNLIEWDDMDRASDRTYVNDGVVTMTLKDSNGASVSGATSLTLSYVTGSNGKYQGTIPYTVSLTAGAEYTLEVTADQGTRHGFINYRVRVVDRTA